MSQAEFIITPEVEAMRTRIAQIGRMLFDRHLTDAAGGNISARVGDLVCMSPTKSGAHYQWQINPENVLVVDLDGNILLGDGKLTRESKVHLSLHRNYRDYGTGVIHCHPRNVMVFAGMAMAMPPALEANRKFGTTPVVDYAPAHSGKLAKFITESMRDRTAMIQKHAAGTIAPWHGLFLMGATLDAAFDAVERFDTNAYVLMMGNLLGGNNLMAEQRQKMEDAIRNFTED